MKLSRRVDYGLVLLRALKVTYTTKKYIGLRRIARSFHLPFSYLEKLAATLKNAGYIESQKGSAGGYRLIKDPAKITLADLVSLFEGNQASVRCMDPGDPETNCHVAGVCPTRKSWTDIEEKIDAVLATITIASL